jgi:hypothetical protein
MTDLAKHVNQMTFGGSIPYEMSQYSAIPSNYYPAQTPNKIPVGFSSSALDEKDRRRKRSDASKSGAEKETIPNMYLVGDGTLDIFLKHETNCVAAKKSTKPCVATSFP